MTGTKTHTRGRRIYVYLRVWDQERRVDWLDLFHFTSWTSQNFGHVMKILMTWKNSTWTSDCVIGQILGLTLRIRQIFGVMLMTLRMQQPAGTCNFKTLAKLVLDRLCLPISNAYVERVFSQAALAKTKVRNKMRHKLLKSILMIRSHLMLNNCCCKDFVVSEEMLINSI